MDAATAKLLLSLAAEISAMDEHNANVDKLMLELAVKAKQGNAETATHLTVIKAENESQMTIDEVIAA